MRRRTDWLVATCAVVSLLCLLVTVVVAATVLDTSKRVERNAASVNDFCDLVLNVHTDRVQRYRGTIEYLKTRAGREPTTLNDYIRVVSLPQLRVEVVKERQNLPSACIAGRALPAIPQQ